MIEHVVRAAEAIQPGQIVLTIGPTSASLREPYTDRADIAWQADPLGTGDAARAALPVLRDDIAWVMVIFGDHPIVDPVTLQQLIDQTRPSPSSSTNPGRMDATEPPATASSRSSRPTRMIGNTTDRFQSTAACASSALDGCASMSAG